MLKKLLILIFFSLGLFLFPSTVHAEGDFATSYNVNYDFDQEGIANVTEEITLTNLTDKLYASTFVLTIGATNVFDITARDSQGPLKTTVDKQDRKTQIKVEFNQQVVGEGKEYPWTLTFKSKDFSQRFGDAWQVTVPKIASMKDLEDFDLSLQVPVSFGDPTSISPEPIKQNEAAGKLNFVYNKDQLSQTGVFAQFGDAQTLEFNLTYKLENDNVLPKISKIVIPSDTSYQEVVINNITPKPENVTVDSNGNSIGWFKISTRQKLEVKVSGMTRLYIKNLENLPPLSKSQIQNLILPAPQWEADNPAIKLKLNEILGLDDLTQNDKAKKIYRFVTDSLQFDFSKLSAKDYQNLGALTTLNNPDKALSSDFADLFVALARSAGIPARKLVGYAYSPNQSLRPLSYNGDYLHSWAEYYDPRVGWRMVDPTWEQTSGGVDYFSSTDLSHFVISTLGSTSADEALPNTIFVNFIPSDKMQSKSAIDISFTSPNELFAGFPSQAKVLIKNAGNTTYHQDTFTLSSSKLGIPENKSFNTPAIPPFGHLEYDFTLKTNSLWESYTDILQVRFGDKSTERKIVVKPFFAYKYFSLGIITVIVVMGGVYLLVLGLFLKTHKGSIATHVSPRTDEPAKKVSKKKELIKKATRVFKKKKSTK